MLTPRRGIKMRELHSDSGWQSSRLLGVVLPKCPAEVFTGSLQFDYRKCYMLLVGIWYAMFVGGLKIGASGH